MGKWKELAIREQQAREQFYEDDGYQLYQELKQECLEILSKVETYIECVARTEPDTTEEQSILNLIKEFKENYE